MLEQIHSKGFQDVKETEDLLNACVEKASGEFSSLLFFIIFGLLNLLYNQIYIYTYLHRYSVYT